MDSRLVWSGGDTTPQRKATAMSGPSLSYHRATLQGAGMPEKRETEEPLARIKSEAQGRGFESRSVRSPMWMLRKSFSPFSYRDNDCLTQCAHSVLLDCNTP